MSKWEARGAYVFDDNNCIGVCDTDNASPAQYEKNAILMAAAPDLLEVAELVVSWLDEEEGAHALCDKALAAISKATTPHKTA